MSAMEMLSPAEQYAASRDDRDRYHAWSDGVPPAKVTVKHDDRWIYNVESSVCGDVWFSVFAGPMSGGTFMPASRARELGNALLAHANYVERTQK